MNLSDKIENGNANKDKGFKNWSQSQEPQSCSSALSPVQPMANALGDSYKTHGHQVFNLIDEYRGNVDGLNDKLSDLYLDAVDGSYAARNLMQQISDKAQAHKPAQFKAELDFQIPSPADNADTIEAFYTKASFLRGTSPKSLPSG